MTPVPLASLDELETWLGSTIDGFDAARAEAVLGAASSLIRSAAGVTWADTPVPDEVHTVALTVAARVYRNPDAASQMSDTTGPFTRYRGFNNPDQVGLYLTGQERAIIARYRPQARGLWTLRTTRDDPVASTGWVPVEGSVNPFPWYAEDLL